jgi:hypothetical protein
MRGKPKELQGVQWLEGPGGEKKLQGVQWLDG